MTTALLNGPLGMEAIHSWDSHAVDINDLSSVPRIRLYDTIEGLHDAPDFDNNFEVADAIIGEIPYPGLPRGKTVVYKGYLEADTLPDLRTLRTESVAAFGNPMVVKRMHIIPPTGYGSDVWFFEAKAIKLEIPDKPPPSLNRMPTKEARDFTLSLHMFDPRFYYDNLESSGLHTSEFDVLNDGLAPTDPTIRVTFTGGLTAGSELAIYNDTILKTLHLYIRDDMDAGSFIFNFKDRSIGFYNTAGDSYIRDPQGAVYFQASLSNWWDKGLPGLQPGTNHMRWVGSEITGMEVTWRHATY